MTDFRARGTIMGPAGLTAVFGMGTGVTPPVWSPEKRPAGGQARRAVAVNPVVGHAAGQRARRSAVADRSISHDAWTPSRIAGSSPRRSSWIGIVTTAIRPSRPAGARRTDRGGQALGC